MTRREVGFLGFNLVESIRRVLMRILMRNTVFKTATLAGLFLCMLALAGAFSGITTSAHATTTAAEVGTDETKLQEFVKAAIDEYYIDTIIKNCDFTKITLPSGTSVHDLIDAQPGGVQGFLNAPAATIRAAIPLFSSLGLTRADMEKGCDFTPHRFREVFGNDPKWVSGSIYLFVMDENGRMLYNGANQSFEGTDLQAIDEGGNNVLEVITDAVEAVKGTSSGALVDYCWDDPATEDDNIDDNDPATAPGDSWKRSYVVNPFEDLGAAALTGDPVIIFGSGIYPTMGNRPSGCDGDGMANGGDGMEPMEPMEPGTVTSVSGGGCAIAAGSDSTTVLLSSNAFNLLLIVSALFFTVSFGSRAAGRRNGIRS
jgi:hypothetical protein